jgi:uncharacterized protein YndB with AHSA1/START domain
VPDILQSISISATAERVFQLVSTAAGFRQWWSSDVVGGDSPEASVDVGFFGRTTVYRLEPVQRESPRMMQWRCQSGKEWEGTLLTFRIMDSASGGTRVRFTHAGWADAGEYFIDCNTSWGGLMFRLRAVAEGHGEGPLFLGDRFAD